MQRWKYNGRTGTVTDEQAAKMKKDVAFRQYEWEPVQQAPVHTEKAQPPVMAPPKEADKKEK